jgi:hypothetical protein
MAVLKTPVQPKPRPLSAGASARAGIGTGGAAAPLPAGVTQSQIAASLAANPQASKGGYEGVGGTYGTATPQTAYTPAAAATDPYSVDGDPILAKIRAGNETARTNARAKALADAKTLAIQFGDATGISDDPAAQAEAAGNPYSTLATLLKGYKDTGLAHDETLNQSNLFYSGARAKTLTEDAGQYQHGVYDARNTALGAYGGIQSGLAAALTGADQSDLAGLGQATDRAGQRAATYGIDPGAPAPPQAGAPPPAVTPLSQGASDRAGIGVGGATNPLANALKQPAVPFGGTTGAPYIPVKLKAPVVKVPKVALHNATTARLGY